MISHHRDVNTKTGSMIRVIVIITTLICLLHIDGSNGRREMRTRSTCYFLHRQVKEVFCNYIRGSDFIRKTRYRTSRFVYQKVIMYGGEIHTIHGHLFARFKKLQFLYANDMEIKRLDNRAFQHTPELKILHLAFNKLEQLHPGPFGYLRQLETLDLTYNLHQRCTHGLFGGLTNLKKLFSSMLRHLTEHIAGTTFLSWTPLKIEGNCFLHLRHLRVLKLAHCGIHHFDARMLNSMPALQHLDLRANKLNRISFNRRFMHHRSLNILVLAQNHLASAFHEHGLFSALPHLQYLNIDFQNCACKDERCEKNPRCGVKIPCHAGMYQGLSYLGILSARGGLVDNVPRDLFKFTPRIQIIDMRQTTTKHFYYDTFKNLRLRKLELQGSNINCDCSTLWLWQQLTFGGLMNNVYGMWNPGYNFRINLFCRRKRKHFRHMRRWDFCKHHICQTNDHPCDRSGGKCVHFGRDGAFLCQCTHGYKGNGKQCDADGKWLTWGPWSRCEASCGKTSKIFRKRECHREGPHSVACPGIPRGETGCRGKPCPINGNWSPWQQWSRCSHWCGPGTKRRERTCSNPAPKYLGKYCPGVYKSSAPCQIRPCRIDGKWSSWGPWRKCSTTCGFGTKRRIRHCNNPKPRYGGRSCPELNNDAALCFLKYCPVDGKWSTWGNWQSCTATCGKATKARLRKCDNPSPRHGGHVCQGLSKEIDQCILDRCPIDGLWSDWSQWSSCAVTCGPGKRQRLRRCNTPKPQHGGKPCRGSDNAVEDCKLRECQVDGKWSKWGPWSSCSISCGPGQKSRTRKCDSPKPQFGGMTCLDRNTDVIHCYEKHCPVNGHWASWERWSTCSVTCGGGTRVRKRQCNNPGPAHGGKQCDNSGEETEKCNQQFCKVDGGWSHWAPWSECSVTCNLGRKHRIRQCNNPSPLHGGKNCSDNNRESDFCNLGFCPVNGEWSPWQPWSHCSTTCNNGEKKRVRHCNNPAPMYGGARCNGKDRQKKFCNEKPCFGFNCTEIGDLTKCDCSTGFQRRGAKCEDFDECSDKTKFKCKPHSSCSNTFGSYVCNCMKGFRTTEDQLCEDIDECKTDTAQCPDNSKCLNTIGSYSCNCTTGFKNGNNTCDDINECISGPICGALGKCENTKGSYACSCADGARLVGKSCQDVNECLLNITNDCNINANCTNTNGSYQCQCHDGYKGDGIDCRRLTECDYNGFACHYNGTCKKLLGVLACWCKRHFEGDGINKCVETYHESRIYRVTKHYIYHAFQRLKQAQADGENLFYSVIGGGALFLIVLIVVIVKPSRRQSSNIADIDALVSENANSRLAQERKEQRMRAKHEFEPYSSAY